MTADTLKSNIITQLDASWATRDLPSAGFGAPTHVSLLQDYVTPTAAGLGDTTSTYRVLRLPSTCSLKRLTLAVTAALDTGGASASLLIDVGAYYSDATDDNTPPADQGNSISANCFLAAHSFGTTADKVATGVASVGDFVIDGLGSLAKTLLTQPLWKQVGLSTDPGGFIDIVFAVHTAANTAASHPVAVTAEITSI